MQIYFLLFSIYFYFFCYGWETDKLIIKVCNFTFAFINTFTSSAEMLFFNFELAEMHPLPAVKKDDLSFSLLRKS